MNLPNKITFSRIMIIPIFMFFIIPFPDWILDSNTLSFLSGALTATNGFIKTSGAYIAAIIFIIAASTDGIDGYIARKRKQITTLGIFLDPIADKLLVTAALLSFLQNNQVTGWTVMVILTREFIVMGLRLVAAGEGIIIAASKWGKIKTVAQIIAIVTILLDNYPMSLFSNINFGRYFMFIAVVITVISGYEYVAKNIEIIHPRKSK